MEAPTPETPYRLEVDNQVYELSEVELGGILFEIVSTLVFLKQVERATFVLGCREDELFGAGSEKFDPVCVGLYRHLKQWRYRGPAYPEFGDVQSFRLHSIVDGLAAVAFFLRGGEFIPHLIVGRPDRDVLTVLDRGRRTRLSLEDPELRTRLFELITQTL